MEGIISSRFDGHPRRLFPKRCDVCSKIFFIPKHRLKFYKTCSYACRGISQRNKISRACATCGKEVLRSPSKLKKSRSGLVFCNRECKQKAQQIGGISLIQPRHYKDGASEYRKRAFRKFGKVCNQCGYSDYEVMLDVHHLDKNRANNRLGNLEVLCVWCHACKTRGIPFHTRGEL
jgi:hypothetical protein